MIRAFIGSTPELWPILFVIVVALLGLFGFVNLVLDYGVEPLLRRVRRWWRRRRARVVDEPAWRLSNLPELPPLERQRLNALSINGDSHVAHFPTREDLYDRR